MDERNEVKLHEQKFIALKEAVFKEIPDQKELLELEIEKPQTEIVPLNFQGILDLKEAIKSQRVTIPRSEGWDATGSQTERNIRQEYRDWRKEQNQKKVSVKDQILDMLHDPKTFTSTNSEVLIANDVFPHHIDHADDAEHFDVWVPGAFNSDVIADTVAKFLMKKNLGLNDFLLFQNPPAGKTVPEVEHLHLYVRKVDNTPSE